MPGRLFGGDLRTGLVRVRNINASSGSVKVTLGAAGTISCTIPLPARIPNTPVAVDFYNLLLPLKSYLAWEENGVILNAGPIWNTSYDLDKRTYTVNAAGLRSYWQFRYVLPALLVGELPIGKDTLLTNLSLRTVAKRLVQRAQENTRGQVPLVLEADFAGTAERTYLGQDLHLVDEKLKQLSEVIGGPDIMFNPEFTNASRQYVQWRMVTGAPRIANSVVHRWDASGLPRSAVKGTKVTRDASSIVTDDYEIGSTGADGATPLMARATDNYLTSLGYPMVEADTDRNSVTKVETLQAHADGAVLAGRQYTEKWQFATRKSIPPLLGTDYNVGDFAKLVLRDDPAYGTQDKDLRLMELESKVGDSFTYLTCAPKLVDV